MRTEVMTSSAWLRGIAVACIGAIGLVTIVGSGGGSLGFPDTSYVNIPGCCSFPPLAAVYPARLTVQVGGPATFGVNTTATNPSYQWRRSSDAGHTYVDIVGATGQTFTLAGAQLPDDGALFLIDVRSNGVSTVQATAKLAVSSMPGIVFSDSEFSPSDWLAIAIANPPQNGPTSSEEQVTTGGHPDAFRRMGHVLTAGPSSLRVFNTFQTASYEPSSQGAVYVIDFTEDCIVTSISPPLSYIRSTLLIEQAGRRYTVKGSNLCANGTWLTLPVWSSLVASDLTQIDGPVCGAGESCPDFSGGATPLRFGYVRDATQAAGAAAGSIVHGIDNWKVTVWRR